MTRSEMVANVKRRAHDYVGQGDYRSAVAVMWIDLAELDMNVAPELYNFAMFAAAHRDEPNVIRFIDGFPED